MRSFVSLSLAFVGSLFLVAGCTTASPDEIEQQPAVDETSEEASAESSAESSEESSDMPTVETGHLSTQATQYSCSCTSGQQLDGGLCYPLCASGYYGVGPFCYEACRPGEVNDGFFCRVPASVLSAGTNRCPWYDKCGLTFAKGCSKCPVGYKNDGCTCRRDSTSRLKSAYDRGAGTAVTCGSY